MEEDHQPRYSKGPAVLPAESILLQWKIRGKCSVCGAPRPTSRALTLTTSYADIMQTTIDYTTKNPGPLTSSQALRKSFGCSAQQLPLWLRERPLLNIPNDSKVLYLEVSQQILFPYKIGPPD